jgi:hypothetical protein
VEHMAEFRHGIEFQARLRSTWEFTGVRASMNGVDAANFTGVWLGLYSYPHMLEPVSFTATPIDTAGAISGSSHETHRSRLVPTCTVFATLSGLHKEGVVEFIKTYDDGILHSRPINCDGEIRDEVSEIEGRWIIPRRWSGRFLMIRSAPNAEKIVRKKYERISS